MNKKTSQISIFKTSLLICLGMFFGMLGLTISNEIQSINDAKLKIKLSQRYVGNFSDQLSSSDKNIELQNNIQSFVFPSSYTIIETNHFPLIAQNIWNDEALGGMAADSGALLNYQNNVFGITRIGKSFLVRPNGELLYLFIENPSNPEVIDSFNFDGHSNNRLHVYTRVLDAEVITQDQKNVRLFVSHHKWFGEEDIKTLCKSTVISRSPKIKKENFLSGSFQISKEDWEIVFSAKPCLGVEYEKNSKGEIIVSANSPLKSNRTGGQLIKKNNSLILSLGDVQLDGKDGRVDAGQNKHFDYGKFVEVNLNNLNSTHFAIGTRNSQGMDLYPDGRIFSTEHGPQGGDELNIVNKGKNYGWGKVSLGVDYGTYKWRDNLKHEDGDFTSPIFAWTPSIGISSVKDVPNSVEEWAGNLIVTSKRSGALFRLSLLGNSINSIERIDLGERIMDIEFFDDGKMVIMTSKALYFMQRMPNNGPALGPILETNFFEVADKNDVGIILKCSGCHSFKNDMPDAPNLKNLIGRPLASTGYEYSKSLKELGGVWTIDRVVSYLINPEQFAPGTKKASFDYGSPGDLRSALEALSVTEFSY